MMTWSVSPDLHSKTAHFCAKTVRKVYVFVTVFEMRKNDFCCKYLIFSVLIFLAQALNNSRQVKNKTY